MLKVESKKKLRVTKVQLECAQEPAYRYGAILHSSWNRSNPKQPNSFTPPIHQLLWVSRAIQKIEPATEFCASHARRASTRELSRFCAGKHCFWDLLGVEARYLGWQTHRLPTYDSSLGSPCMFFYKVTIDKQHGCPARFFNPWGQIDGAAKCYFCSKTDRAPKAETKKTARSKKLL